MVKKKTTKDMEQVNNCEKMEIIMKVNGKMIK